MNDPRVPNAAEEEVMKLYPTEKALYDSCMKSEAGITVIAMPAYDQDGELLGYYKYYV